MEPIDDYKLKLANDKTWTKKFPKEKNILNHPWET